MIVSEILPGVTELTLNRPDKRNALSLQVLEDLFTACEGARHARVLILRGSGPAFCAGLDLEEAANESQAQRLSQGVARALLSLYSAPAVTIAVVQGVAMAGGAGLVAACDFAIAAKDARIGFPETRRGLVAALVMTVLRRRLSGRHLSELLLLGEAVDADRALAIGLVHRVVTSNQLNQAANELVQQALQGAPMATAQTKRLMERLESRSLSDDLSMALATHNEVRGESEAQEGIRAFLEKRPPSWNPDSSL